MTIVAFVLPPKFKQISSQQITNLTNRSTIQLGLFVTVNVTIVNVYISQSYPMN